MDNYEGFKQEVLSLTKIDLSSYKEKQMRRRIDSLVTKHKCKAYRYSRSKDNEQYVVQYCVSKEHRKCIGFKEVCKVIPAYPFTVEQAVKESVSAA